MDGTLDGSGVLMGRLAGIGCGVRRNGLWVGLEGMFLLVELCTNKGIDERNMILAYLICIEPDDI